MLAFFASDLHGRVDRYEKLLDAAAAERPMVLFLGGDLLPSGLPGHGSGFVGQVLAPGFARLRDRMGAAYPQVFLILGNDDPRIEEAGILEAEGLGLWRYVHGRVVALGDMPVVGYACVPPTPFRLKDWERYDVSRYVDPGCVDLDEGRYSTQGQLETVRYGTIAQDLDALIGSTDLARGIVLFHGPPYQTLLDRAALDGRKVDHVPLDVHVGSIAVRRFIEARQPRLTLHGHIHESARLTGAWQDRIGRTVLLSAAHDGPELALVRFDPEHPEVATRDLI
jgi:uncharacterized protein